MTSPERTPGPPDEATPPPEPAAGAGRRNRTIAAILGAGFLVVAAVVLVLTYPGSSTSTSITFVAVTVTSNVHVVSLPQSSDAVHSMEYGPPTKKNVPLGRITRLDPAAAGGPTAGEPAPPTPFLLFDGTEATFADYRGRPLVVNFWASWCPSCVAEMSAAFRPVQEQLGDRVAFLGMNTQD